MEQIIQPIDKQVLKAELTPERKLRRTNKSNNEIYIVTWQDSPNVLREIGRLREIAFRAAGGGTGKALDLDEFDTCTNPYKQLIVWNPEDEEIIGGYRYFPGNEISLNADGQPRLATSHMFHFSERFISDYMPQTIELGRSFVTLEYQNTGRSLAKSLFALDNLWDGLGGDKDRLVTAVKPLLIDTDPDYLASILTEKDFKADYRLLNGEVRKLGFNIPPLVNAYMSLSPTMKLFGTAINDEFGSVEETGILIAVDEILAEKRVRHIDSYVREHPEAADLLGSVLNPPFKK